jgi:gliding motility-associated-like protein
LPAITGTNLSGSQAYYNGSQVGGGTMITGDITSTQTVYIFDQTNGCEDEISFNVTINPSPNVTAVTGGADYCVGDAVNDILVTVDGTAGWTVFYTLDGVAQTATGNASPISLGNAAGVYVITAVTDANCSNTATGTQTIVLHNYPVAPLAGTDANYCSTADFDPMTASGSGGTLSWYNNPSLTTSIATGGSLVPSNVVGATTYYVTETANNCEGPASSVVITIEDCEVVIPTAFTPDGDTKNDFWEILNLDAAYPNNEVFVYNRWGNLLYTSVKGDYAGTPWDGSYNGQLLPVGSYYFIINFNDAENTVENGTVSIILNEK